MNKKLNHFPTLKMVESGIKKIKDKGLPQFENYDSIDNYLQKITDLITEELGVFPNMLNSSNREDFEYDLYRVRPVEEIQNINLFSQHSYPPSDFVKFGRCNFPKYPVFYCSNNPMTSLIEVARESGGENRSYCISKWKIKSTEKIFLQTFMQIKLSEGHDFEDFKKLQQSRINEPFDNKLTEDQCNGLLALLAFLDESFITDKVYNISASLAHRAFYPKHQIKADMLLYPSVQSRYAGTNFAVHPNYVDQNMYVDRFYIFDLEKYDSDRQNLDGSITQYGIVERNHIRWKNVHPNDEKYLEMVKEDFSNLFEPGNNATFVQK